MKTSFIVKRLPVQTGPCGWNAVIPPRIPRPPLGTSTTADIAIIGAGFAGLSAARRLRQLDPTLRIAILEAGSVGNGPAGRNSGFMIDLPHDISSDNYESENAERDRRQILLHRAAIDFANDIANEYVLGKEIFDPSGKYNVAISEEGDQRNRDYSRHLDTLHERNRLLNASETRALTGSDHFTSALFTSGTVMLQPAAFVQAVADGLAHDVSIFENSPVQSLHREGGAWRLMAPHGELSATKVILATNGHAQSFGFFPRQFIHIFTYASMTRLFDPGQLAGERKWGATPAHPMGTTVRRIPGAKGDRIIIRSRYTCNPSMTVSDADVASAGRIHDRKFAARFPMLTGLDMEYRWAGHMCVSRNGVPAFGEIARDLFSACCCNGLGLSKGTASGIAAAESALGINSPLTRAMCSQGAPMRFPPEPFATIGAKAILRFREWVAAKE